MSTALSTRVVLSQSLCIDKDSIITVPPSLSLSLSSHLERCWSLHEYHLVQKGLKKRIVVVAPLLS